MPVDVTIEAGIATVTLNRPEAMNSIDPEMRAQLQDTWRMIGDNDEIMVAIITGAGDRAFCTGSDLKKTMPTADESFARQMFWTGDSHMVAGLAALNKPVIAAINGYAVAGGLEIVLACDIRVAADTAQFGLSEVRVGSMPGAAGTQQLPRMINRATAMKMLLTGDRIGAQEALRAGLVSDVVAPAELILLANQIARRIADNAPLSVRAVKMLAQRATDIPLEHGMWMERLAFGLLRNTEDRVEGRVAFKEKRKPAYKGQ